jgi:uncharacterized protein (DUF2336 family)
LPSAALANPIRFQYSMSAVLLDLQNAAPEPKRSLIDDLIDAVNSGSAKRRLHVVQSITELFIAGSRSYSSEQVALFDDLLQQLAAEIEVKALVALSQRIAKVDNAPPGLVRAFAFDNEIAVAEPILKNSQQLTDADLVENATTKSQDHLFAIAQRLKLSEVVTDALVEHGNRRVVHQVAGNPGARFSLAGYGKLTSRALRSQARTDHRRAQRHSAAIFSQAAGERIGVRARETRGGQSANGRCDPRRCWRCRNHHAA